MTQAVIRPLELRKVLNKVMGTVHDRIYYESAPSDPVYPYVVYIFPDTDDQDNLETFMMEVDAWDKPIDGSTVDLETLIGNIDLLLHRRVFNSNGVFFSIYRESRRTITDSDKNLKRRQYEYQIRVMGA